MKFTYFSQLETKKKPVELENYETFTKIYVKKILKTYLFIFFDLFSRFVFTHV